MFDRPLKAKNGPQNRLAAALFSGEFIVSHLFSKIYRRQSPLTPAIDKQDKVMPKLRIVLLPLLMCIYPGCKVPELSEIPTLGIFEQPRERGKRSFVTISSAGIEGIGVDLWCYEDEFGVPKNIVESEGKIFLEHESKGNTLKTSFEPEPGGVVVTMTLTGPDKEAIQKVGLINMCITYQRSSAFGNIKDKFDESYLEDFVGRSFVFLGKGLTRLNDTDRVPSVDGRDNPFSARGRAPRPWVQAYAPAWRNHADFVHTFYGKRPLSSDRPIYPIMGVVSHDQRFLSAFAWPDCELLVQLFLSCLHPNPMISEKYDSQTHRSVTRGKIYFMENNPDRLLQLFKYDFPDWRMPVHGKNSILAK